MSRSLNLVFCGTPRFAVPTLNSLVEAGFRISLVVTQPDKPRGRGLELSASPVKQRAIELALPSTQPDVIKNTEAFRVQLAALHPDAIVVVGYGRIIPMDDRSSAVGQHQPARFSPAQLPRRRPHPVGDRLR